MNASPRSSQSDLNITTQLQLSTHGFDNVVLKSLLTQDFAQNDSTYLIHRKVDITVYLDPDLLLDKFAMCKDWVRLRVDSHTLIFRSIGLLGMISTDGCAQKCSVHIRIWADSVDHAEAIKDFILADISQHQIKNIAFSLNWRFLDCKGEVKRADTEEQASDVLFNEAYPALCDVEEFITRYLTAPESVLVLQGPPGTGKTRLIRSILGHISRRKGVTAEVLYTSDNRILETDEVFVEFITGTHDVFVVEDADHLLMPRADGNKILHRFLGIADGIAQPRGRKIIFSTNLPAIRDIDTALVRPGRCFAHVFLQELSAFQTQGLLKRLCRDNPDHLSSVLCHLEHRDKKAYSVAEVYAAHREVTEHLAPARVLWIGGASAQHRPSFGFAPS